MSTEIFGNNKKKILFANNIKNLRKYKNITADTLSSDTKLHIDSIKGYEKNIVPPLNNSIVIAKYFEISLDFFILWNESYYPHNIKLLSLAEKIDKLDFNERYKVEGSASSLIGTNNINQEIKFKSDIPFDLSNNIHENIKILRDKKGVSQKTVANFSE